MSKLRKALEEYLAVRRALGFKLNAPGRLLHQFMDFAETERASFITRDLALRWATQSTECQPVYWANRLSVVRQFAEYHSAIDPRTEIPPAGLLPQRFHKRSPYIYSDTEIERLITAAKQLRSPLKLQGATYFAFFGLLAVTGMRVSEVLGLDREDVDLAQGVLIIQQTKFGKSRLIPLHPSTRDVLSQYAALRDRTLPSLATSAFFVSERGTRFSKSTVWRIFVKLTRGIGLPSGTGSGPRLHDLRHRFAIRTLCRLPWSCQCSQHLLVLVGGSRTSALGVQATGLSDGGGHAMKTCCQFPELLQIFFTNRLVHLRQASPHTIASYRDTFRLLVNFAHQRLAKEPSKLTIEDLDAPFIGCFLNHLEKDRGNRTRSRNVRLAAIHSFFRYVALNEPAHMTVAQRVLALPTKRFDRRPIDFLTPSEVDALLSAPNQATWGGRRDYALLLTATQTGLRVSELTGLRCEDIVLSAGAHVRCRGKGRKERSTPLRKEAVAALDRWIRERAGGPSEPLFPNARGGRLSQDGVAYIIHKHVTKARQKCPTLTKKRISAHVLRHTLAMDLLHHGIDRSVIALWLGHESVETVQMYLHADMAMKEQALAKMTPSKVRPARYRPDDHLLAFLKSL